MPDIFDTIEVNIDESSYKDSGADIFDQLKEPEEGFWKSTARTALQIPQGVAEMTTPGIAANLFQLLALGESELDPEEWNKLRGMYAEKGIDFDEAYQKGREEMLQSIPTVSNISRKVEEETDLPLQPKNQLQDLARLVSSGFKLTPGTASQKTIGAGITGITKETLDESNLPEPIKDVLSLVIGTKLGSKTPSVSIGNKLKESGLPERGFEKLQKPRELSENKMNQINKKLESDFKDISSKIIEDSTIGETSKNLANDPFFKSETQEFLNQAKELAKDIEETIPSKDFKKAIADKTKKEFSGFSPSEYDVSYKKNMSDFIKSIDKENITASELVDQYRKNNKALSEFYEPGSSKALNRAKKDALLDQNRVISEIMEKQYKDTILPEVFKEGNSRWSKIMDAEMVDDFVDNLFKDNINYKKMRDFFDKNGYKEKFKKALGDKKYKDFEVLMKDMLSSEKPYKMLNVAKSKGFEDLAKNAGAFIFHPTIGKAKLGLSIAKETFKTLVNSMLDKPQISIIWKDGVEALKKGEFKKSEVKFNSLSDELNSKHEALKKFNSRNYKKELIGDNPDS